MRKTVLECVLALGVLLGQWAGRDALAGVVDTPSCRADLAKAGRLIEAIQSRENSVARGDMAGLCRLWRRNLTDMTTAGKLMEPCLTGHDKGENLGQIWGSAEDIQAAINRNCR